MTLPLRLMRRAAPGAPTVVHLAPGARLAGHPPDHPPTTPSLTAPAVLPPSAPDRVPTATSTLAASLAPAPRARPWRAILLVLAFWWGATGLLIVLQRSAGSRAGALGLALLAAPAGFWLVARARDQLSEGAAVRSFLGGALLWTCVQSAFYGGWVVGLAPQVPADGPTVLRALDAIAATGHSALLAGGLLVGAVQLTRGARNRVGVWTFVVFWAVHELAKLNVFLGVVNPGAQFLPDYLAYLQRYFGPPRNSRLLPASVLALLAWTAWLAVGAVRARLAVHRVGAVLLAMVVLLAAVEHALLGTTRQLGWWDAFLALRAAP